MGRRSTFPRLAHDTYATPPEAVEPLLLWLTEVRTFAEPCCGEGALVRALEARGLTCVYADDLAQGADASDYSPKYYPDAIITNPPWSRPVLHALIIHFASLAPTWLLIDQNWIGTKQAAPYLPHCSHVVPIGRVRWIPGSATVGKDDAAWFRFDHRHCSGPRFYPYRAGPDAYQP